VSEVARVPPGEIHSENDVVLLQGWTIETATFLADVPECALTLAMNPRQELFGTIDS